MDDPLRRAPAASRRRSTARRLLVVLCYAAFSRGGSLLGFVAAPRLQADARQPAAARLARGGSGGGNLAVPPGDIPVDEARAETTGEGPFGIRYRSYRENTPILLGLVVFALLLVFRQDVVTILALYEYRMSMEANWMATSALVLARLPTDLVTGYGEAATAQPILVKAITSGVAYFWGDLLAQAFEGRVRIEWLDLARGARNAAAGFFLHGPALHFWILFLEGPFSNLIGASAENHTEPWVIVSKIVMDQTVFAFALNGLYALFVGFLASKPLDEVVQRTKDTIGPSMLSSWRFWPFVHMVTYSPLMPIEFKVLWNDVAEIAWVTILSLIANGEREDNPESQKVVVTEDLGVLPEVEIEMVSRLEKVVTEEVPLGPSGAAPVALGADPEPRR